MAAAAEHGRTVHGMTDADFTDENVEIVRSTPKTCRRPSHSRECRGPAFWHAAPPLRTA